MTSGLKPLSEKPSLDSGFFINNKFLRGRWTGYDRILKIEQSVEYFEFGNCETFNVKGHLQLISIEK